MSGIACECVAHELAELTGGLMPLGRGSGDLNCVRPEVRQVEIDEQFASVGMWVRAHATISFWRQLG